MSTRSFIAKQIGEDQFRTIYCQHDGYLSYNGAMLIDHYNTPEIVDKLLDLGDLSSLDLRLDPDPSRPHSFDYSERQDGVTVAYGRDRGEDGVEARTLTLADLDDPNNWTEYVYIFTDNNEWKYFHANHSKEGLRDVDEDLNKIYAQYGISRPADYYGFITDDLVNQLKAQESESVDETAFEITMQFFLL